MATISVGTLFSVPLPDENEYAYGYIVYRGDFIYSNIYKYVGSSKEIPEDIEKEDIVIRDLMHDRSPFLPRMKRLGRLFYWHLSKKQTSSPLPPSCSYVLHGGHTSFPKIYDILNKTYVDDVDLSKNIKDIPEEKLYFASYYPKLIYAKINNKKLAFDDKSKSYVIGE